MSNLIQTLIGLCQQASEQIQHIRDTQPIDVTNKPDDTPVTQADLCASEILISGLRELTPTIPIISEEQELHAYETRRYWPEYWLIDPLDGTKEFIDNTQECCINIALIRGNQPQFGLIYAIFKPLLYFAARGEGAYKIDYSAHKQPLLKYAQPIHCKPSDDGIVRVTVSRRYNREVLDQWMEALGPYEVTPCGSALKFGLIAEGLADVYPRLGQTSEWDTAAGDILLREAGGKVVNLQGHTLQYNKENILNPEFIATRKNLIDTPSD